MEQYQEEDGRVRIPKKLLRWFDGQTHLEKPIGKLISQLKNSRFLNLVFQLN